MFTPVKAYIQNLLTAQYTICEVNCQFYKSILYRLYIFKNTTVNNSK